MAATKELRRPRHDGPTIDARCKDYLIRRRRLNRINTRINALREYAYVVPLNPMNSKTFSEHLFENASEVLERLGYDPAEVPHFAEMLAHRNLENLIPLAREQAEYMGKRTLLRYG